MVVVQTFEDRKKELEARIQAFEAERVGLLAEIPRLREQLAILKLEHQARRLESEVETLKSERGNLQQEIASYDIGSVEPQPAS